MMRLPTVGELFDGRYRLEALLGEGGTACVFRATDQTNGLAVAVKIVRPDDDGYTSDIKARFHREVEIIAGLTCPHTVTMYNWGRDPGGRLYMVFELVPGEDLVTLISRAGRLDAPTTRHILEQVLQALREAHDAGLLHRDVKPDNIRVHERHGDEIRVKLLDFGIARRADGSQSITRTGELVGTPRYMSPEQLTERPLSPASDLYSLGIVGFEMLMGTTALQGHGWTDQVDRLMSGHVFSIPEIDRIGPIARVVTKMCARDPEDRYPSAAAVLAALDRIEGNPSLPTMRQAALPARRATTAQRLAQIPRWQWAVLVGVLGVVAWQLVRLNTNTGAEQVTPPDRPDGSSVLLKTAGPAPGVDPAPATVDLGIASDVHSTDVASGCGAPPPFIGTSMLDSLGSDPLFGGQMSWTVHVPANYQADTAHPLIVLFHQDAERPVDILAHTRLDELADEHGIVLLVPGWGRLPPAWNKPTFVAPTRRGVEEVRDQLCIDPDRIFLLGHGPGGQAAIAMACVLRDVAAVATTSYAVRRNVELCDAYRNIPTLSLFPMEDRNTPPGGGPGCSLFDKIPLDDQEAMFRSRNGCERKARVYARHKGSVCNTWTCDAPYVSCRLDGGRGWPGAAPRPFDLNNCDGEPADFPYSDTIWDFFTSIDARH